MFWAGAGAVVRQNFSVGRHKAAQSLSIFVVDRVYLIAAEVAIFFDHRLIVSLLWSHNLKLDIEEKN